MTAPANLNRADPTRGLRLVLAGVFANLGLAIVKIVTGVIGHSYALIADGIESAADIVTSLVVFTGIKVAIKPPDEEHPFGHGRAESIAALFVCVGLLVAAMLIAWQSINEIRNPHTAPAWFTLPVLVMVIGLKVWLSRWLERAGRAAGSMALRGDALHHFSDALTSAAAFVGISLALLGGPGWESADDWAALVACGVIAANGVVLLRSTLFEMMDGGVQGEFRTHVRELAAGVDGVDGIEKCRIRKSGFGFLMDIHVEVDGRLSVEEGHEIARAVKHTLLDSGLGVVDVVVHIEPSPATIRGTAPPARTGPPPSP